MRYAVLIWLCVVGPVVTDRMQNLAPTIVDLGRIFSM
jgi:hypothetical protein